MAAWRAWAAWALAGLFFCYAFVQRMAPSVMIPELMREFAVGAAALGTLSAFYFYAYAGLQIPIGMLMDRVGPRRLLAGSAAVAALGSLVMAASPDFAMAGFGRLLVGVGVAFAWVGLLTIVTHHFPANRFALLTGCGQAAAMVGAMLGQAPTGLLVESIGWRHTLGILAGVALAAAGLFWWAIRDRPLARQESAGLIGGLKTVARNRYTWLSALYSLCMATPLLSFAGLWAVPYMKAVYGLDRVTASTGIALIYFGWALGAPSLGWLADRLGTKRPLMLTTSCVALATMTAFLYLPGLPLGLIYALFFVNGLASSTMFMGFACARGHNPIWAVGAAYGIVNTGSTGGAALFQPVIGLVLDSLWTGGIEGGARVYEPAAYGVALLSLPALYAAAVLAAFAMREPPREGSG
ncbi:MAG: MFS transporter [Alphaproteobacteria bacterium]|nr:MFS transporter [Alphaproteobacteria bacterium]